MPVSTIAHITIMQQIKLEYKNIKGHFSLKEDVKNLYNRSCSDVFSKKNK